MSLGYERVYLAQRDSYYLWMNWISEAPDQDQRWSHDDSSCLLNTIVKIQPLTNGNCHYTSHRRMPVNTCDTFVFTELQVCE